MEKHGVKDENLEEKEEKEEKGVNTVDGEIGETKGPQQYGSQEGQQCNGRWGSSGSHN